jgi:hypothetical protein
VIGTKWHLWGSITSEPRYNALLGEGSLETGSLETRWNGRRLLAKGSMGRQSEFTLARLAAGIMHNVNKVNSAVVT